MSKTAKIVILLIVVIAVGWGIGKYTAPSASQENGTNINAGTDLGAGGRRQRLKLRQCLSLRISQILAVQAMAHPGTMLRRWW